jgi:hypothetical protein
MGSSTKYNDSFLRHRLQPQSPGFGEVFQATTARLNTQGTTKPSVWTEFKRNISGQDLREMLRISFNIILVSKIQPKAWNTNSTMLIPKQGKNGRRVENYR